ncbi:hypothetical protein A5761_01620 [Mycolicibacterium setense]|nr:hypothetical protein A5761_01620 [Mycolicibacterium setense]
MRKQVTSGQSPPSGDVEAHFGTSSNGSIFRQIAERADKSITELTADDIRNYAPMVDGVDPFELSISELFLSYYRREDRNSYLRFKAAEGATDVKPLSKEEFEERNGPPPWDLLNEVLNSIGMPYRFNKPAGVDDPNFEYEPLLQDKTTGTEVRVEDLSSGEITLMAIVISIYSGLHLRNSLVPPKMLLLDESDSALHPSMVQTLLDVITNTLIDGFGTKVILTTHSPTTVALAPEESLYVMRRGKSPRIVKATRDEALSSLLVGVPTLSVSNDNRRQVFAEAPDDQECYQLLWTLLRPHLETVLSLEFIASGSGGSGNRFEAEQIVASLRANGVKVLGLVDRDAGETPIPAGVVVNEKRYAIENLLLDPVAIGILLVRERIIATADVLDVEIPFHQIDQEQAQRLCDHVVARAYAQLTVPQQRTTDAASTVEVEYIGGDTVTVPAWVLNHNGHDWEALLLAAFPGLNKFQHNRKLSVIELVFRDVPRWVPVEIKTMLEKLLTYDDGAGA